MFIKSTPNQIEDPPVQDRRSRTSDSSGLKYKNNWKLTTASLTNKLIKPWIRFMIRELVNFYFQFKLDIE